MGACSINDQINLEDFQKLGITLADVHTHFLETGNIGSPEFIRYKLDKLKQESVPDSISDKTEEPGYSFTEKTVNSWLKKLSKGLGVGYEIITEEEAVELHNSKGKTYNNEPAFFHNGKAYFITGRLTPQSVVHEFSHPFVKMLMKDNPELFNSLYDRLLATEDGKIILDEVTKKYKNRSEDSLKEEVFVRALTASTMMASPKEEFSSWIKEFLFNIKQALRKLIGKSIDIQTLSPMTTMRELADILSKGDKVAMDAAIYTDAEIFDYMRDYDSFMDGFTGALNNKEAGSVQDLINNVVNAATAQLISLEENKAYVPGLQNLADLIVKEYDQGVLAQIKKELGPLATSNDIIISIAKKDGAGNLINAAEVVSKRLQALTNTLYNVNDMLKTMTEQIDDVAKLTSKEQIDTLYYYSTFLDNWNTVVTTFSDISLGYSVNENDDLDKLAKELSGRMAKAQKKLLDIKTDAVLDVLWDMIQPASDKVLKDFNEIASKKAGKIIDLTKIVKGELFADQDAHWLEFHNMTKAQYEKYMTLKNAGAVKNKEYAELEALWMKGLEMTKDKLKMIITNQGFDSNYFNGLLEAASFNTDVAVHGLQEHIQSEIAKYEIYAKTKFEDYLNAVQPHLNKVNFQNRGSVGKKLGQLNKVSVIVNDEIVEHEEWGFLQEWIGWESDKVGLQFAKNQAADKYAETNNDVDKDALDAAIQEYADWKNKYMNQRYSSEYYEVDKLLTKDAIGKDAKDRRESIFEKMAIVEQDANLNNEVLTFYLNELWNEYKLLQSFHNLDGTMKTGADLEVSKRLKEYSEAKNKFIVFYEKPGAFQDAYDAYSKSVINSGSPYSLDVNSDYQKLMNKWLEQNTVVSLKNSILDKRQKLLTERASLLETLIAANKNIDDDSEQRQLISDMVKLVTDNSNQPDGITADPEIRKKVRDAHQEIDDMKNNLYNYKGLGLTRAEVDRLTTLENLSTLGTISSAENTERLALLAKQLGSSSALGLDATVVARLNAIDGELSKMSSSVPTDSFMSVIKNMLDNNPALLDVIAEYLEDNGITVKPTIVEDVFAEDILDFVVNGDLQKAFAASSEFKAFVEENFYEKSVYNADDSKYHNVLTLTDLWFHNKSADVFDYKTKMLKDANGNNLGLIEINGAYRSPSMAYQQRMVKDEYVTEKIVGQTVDNRGKWLPKAEPTNKYRNNAYEAMKSDDPEMFDFLETLKAEYLKMQEGAENYDKHYLAYPQIRKTRLENWTTGNVFKWKRRYEEFKYGVGDDLESLGVEKQLTADDLVEEHKMSHFEHQTAAMPTKGVARLRSVQDQSTDILKTMPEYMASLMHKEGARKASSFSRSLLDVVNNENATSRSKDNARMAIARSKNSSGLKFWSGGKNRKEALNTIIERDLDGIFVTGKLGGAKLQKSLQTMAKLTGFKLFSANPVSALKNFNQIKLTGLTHAIAGDEINVIDGGIGEIWALNATRKISQKIRNRSHKTYHEQIVQLFDPAGGRSGETMGDNLSRTFVGDMLDLKFLQNGRKWMELEGTVQNFAALMHNKKVKITTSNGSTKTIPYLNAFELVDGKLQTKKGVESDYALSYDSEGKPVVGDGLLKQRLHIQQVIATWNGTFAKKDSSGLERYVLGKQMTFLRKHLIPMVVKNIGFSVGSNGNFAKKRMNWTTQKAEYGHFISTLKTLKNTLQSGLTNIPYMTKQELISLAYVVNYIAVGHFLLPYLQGLVTMMKPGDDDDDDDEKVSYTSMKLRSGNLEDEDHVITTQDGYDFDRDGFLLNQTALLMAQTKDEYNSLNFASWDGVKDNVRNLNPSPIMLAIQTKAIIKVINLSTGSANTEYTERENGPYFFHEKGFENGKLYDALFDMVGLNGKNLAPVEALESYNQFKKLQ